MAMRHESLPNRVIGPGARNFARMPNWPNNMWTGPGPPTAQPTECNACRPVQPWSSRPGMPVHACHLEAGPALAPGNPVVLKPAEWSPLSASLLADLADEAGLPPGVFNLFQGIGTEVGPLLTSDQRVRGFLSPAPRDCSTHRCPRSVKHRPIHR
ncbi:MAG: hypothetical protein Ct9H300mP12_06720 [Acidimicrobiales bacterium]|nr:MAG: hypothetical protein Ct9H300mP12_06720 [Acidimicrobiales bacterium]